MTPARREETLAHGLFIGLGLSMWTVAYVGLQAFAWACKAWCSPEGVCW